MRASPVITTRQRRTDLFAALAFQIGGLIAVNELHRGEYALPLVAIAVSAYAASALATLYVLVVTEFKPIAFESASFTLWIIVNAAFVASLTIPFSKAIVPEPRMDPRDSVTAAGMHPPGEAVKLRSNDALSPEVRRIKTLWPSLPEETRKKIMDLATPDNVQKQRASELPPNTPQ